MPYPLAAAAFEAEMKALADKYTASLCRKTAFPMRTNPVGMNSSTYSFLEIGSRAAPSRVTALIIAGMHAREWAQPDAALSFAQKLLDAYQRKVAFEIPAYTEGGKTVGPVSAPESTIKKIIDNLDILIVPLANPDGRAYSQSSNKPTVMDWRMNRASIPAGPPGAVGVDLNRNFDIAWDCDVYYSSGAVTHFSMGDAKKPADPTQTFRGNAKPPPDNHHPALEWESKNLLWLIENRPVTFFVDLHSANLTIMHPWAIEANGSDPSQTFLKVGPPPAGFDGARDGPSSPGRPANAYSEYFPPSLLHEHEVFAQSMHKRIRDATGRRYRVGGLAEIMYPTTGSFMDYVFSRQFTLPGSPKIYAFAAEFGQYGGKDEHFHPDATKPTGYPRVEREVHALLLAFLEAALSTVPPPPPAPSPGAGSKDCFLKHLALNLTVAGVWLGTVRDGRDALLAGRYSRRPLLVIDRVYRRLSVHMIRRLGHRRWALLLIAYGVLAPVAAVTGLVLRWRAR